MSRHPFDTIGIVEGNSIPQLLLLILILQTKALGAATHSVIWYPISTPPRLGCFIYSGALEIGTTTGLQLQHLQDLLNKHAALIMLLYFVQVLLLYPCFDSLSIKMCSFSDCCFVTMSIRNDKCLNVLTYIASVILSRLESSMLDIRRCQIYRPLLTPTSCPFILGFSTCHASFIDYVKVTHFLNY
jgi:hypothetical protein